MTMRDACGVAGTQFLLAMVVVTALCTAHPAQGADQQAAAQQPFHYDSKNRRDPFVTLVRDGRLVSVIPGSRVETTRPILYGIVWDPAGHSIALINDEEVKTGDTVGTYQVIEIRSDAVVLSDGGEPVVLQITFDAPPVQGRRSTTKGGEGP